MTIDRQVTVFALSLALAVAGAASVGVQLCLVAVGCEDPSRIRFVQVCPADPSRRRFFIPQPHRPFQVITRVYKLPNRFVALLFHSRAAKTIGR